MHHVHLLWLLPISFSLACASTSDLQGLVVKRASFDMNCPSSSLQITDLPGQAYGVIGCGQQASYVLAGQGCETPRSLGRKEAERYCTPVFDHGGVAGGNDEAPPADAPAATEPEPDPLDSDPPEPATPPQPTAPHDPANPAPPPSQTPPPTDSTRS